MFKKHSNLDKKMALQNNSLFEEQAAQLAFDFKIGISVKTLLSSLVFISQEVELAVNNYLEKDSFASEKKVYIKDLSLECMIDAAKRLSNELNDVLCNSFSDLQRVEEKDAKKHVLVFNKI